ncbi:MAG: thiol-disulfide isomerase/thioredoxin [Flavobacteriales bacterium]|jgi:thiol-disulfide isomerase/thioredoxin
MIRTILASIAFSLLTLAPAEVLCQQDKSTEVDYQIKGQIKGLSDTTIFLANYYGNRLYYNDTTYCDKQGRFSFKGKPYDEQGKYAVVIPGPHYFDFLVAGEEIDFVTDTLNLVEHLDIKKSVDNQIFFAYIQFINKKRGERMPYEMILSDSLGPDDQKEAARESVLALNDEVVQYQKDLIEEHKDRLVGKYVRMSMDVEIPETAPEGADEKVWKYMWYRTHYWDNCDLTDNRMVRDQTFHKIVDKYVNKVIPQMPDSVSAMVSELVDRLEGQDDLFKYILHFATYNAQSSNIMCMDKVLVQLVDRYYKTGKVDWLSDEKMAELIEASDKKKPTLCGEIVPDITLPDLSDTNWVSLHDIDSKYTAIIIWESTCGHCKKEMPKLMQIYEDWKDRGLTVYAIGNDYERGPWKEFIQEKELEAWIHVSDDPLVGNDNPDTVRYVLMNGITNIESLNFRTTFDIFSTPKIYLLDEDKRVIAKQLGADQIDMLLTRLEENEANDEGDGTKTALPPMRISDPDDE